MNLTNRANLISEFHLPTELDNLSLFEKYVVFKKLYMNGSDFILLNNTSVFGPFPVPSVVYDISEEQKLVIYNPEVTKVLNWVNSRIVINLSYLDYKTLDVLVRIATGMLNKLDIPSETKILFHNNMVGNLRREHSEIMNSQLPFLD